MDNANVIEMSSVTMDFYYNKEKGLQFATTLSHNDVQASNEWTV